jgi:hypothetical protein
LDSFDKPEPEPLTIQVREFPHSATVSVVVWNPEEPDYGLRATLRRDGSLVRDHRLYVSTYYFGYDAIGGQTSYARNTNRPLLNPQHWFVRTVVPALDQLQSTGTIRDAEACHWGSCSPFETFEVRVPDSLLRANRDSVAIKLYGRGDGEFVLAVRRDLIDPYLRTVDSVAAALRKQ